jgi:50S ribosomal subunit-associated GTPase HflX
MVVALNKIDRLPQPELPNNYLVDSPKQWAISALNGSGLPELLQSIEAELYENYTEISVQIPYTDGQLIYCFTSMPGGAYRTLSQRRFYSGSDTVKVNGSVQSIPIISSSLRRNIRQMLE